MYMHAHIRYAEALARFGDAQALWLALRQINPIGLRDLAASASLRQLNCYYSSSDADFRDRTEASLEYEKVRTGDVALEGGWRVYSSGSGIAVRLLVQCFLGLRAGKHSVIIDPVIDPSLSGLEVEWHTDDHHWHVTYRVGTEGSGVQSVEVNGILLVGMRLPNPYRTGGICFLFDEWQRAASGGVDHVVITVG
jgi:cellobiose phosphorylase